MLAVGRVAGRKHRVLMTGKRSRMQYTRFLIAMNVPHTHALVIAAGQHPLAVRRKRARPNGAAVTPKCRHILSACGVPNPDGVILAAAQHKLAIRRETDRSHG